MSVPVMADAGTGLPIGVQFAAGFGREDGCSTSPGSSNRPARGRAALLRSGRGTGRATEACRRAQGSRAWR
nr:hypothetical protein [Spongiactinospora rosea]